MYNKFMTSPSPLRLDTYYHIFNRGNNRQNIFLETRNYDYFLKLYGKYIDPVVETFAYCLLRNHFHILIRTRTVEEQKRIFVDSHFPPKFNQDFQPLEPSRQFSHFFNAYAKAGAFAVIIFIFLFFMTLYSLRITKITRGAYE